MDDVRVTTTTGAESLIEGAAVEAFKASLRGELLRPGDHGYDKARKVWNGMIDKRPALIARCAGVAEVIQAVNVVRTHRLLVSVRGGGHNIPGNAGEKVLRPLREFGPPLADQIRPMAYREVQTLLNAATVRERRYYIKSSFMTSISDGAIDTLVARFTTIPSPLSFLFFQQLGTAANRVGATDTAFSHRGARCEWGCLSCWPDPAEDGVNIWWTRELWEAMRPFTTGGDYVTQLGLEAEEGTERIKAAYGSNYERLVALKHTYDPTNLFRHNQNIKPTAGSRDGGAAALRALAILTHPYADLKTDLMIKTEEDGNGFIGGK